MSLVTVHGFKLHSHHLGINQLPRLTGIHTFRVLQHKLVSTEAEIGAALCGLGKKRIKYTGSRDMWDTADNALRTCIK